MNRFWLHSVAVIALIALAACNKAEPALVDAENSNTATQTTDDQAPSDQILLIDAGKSETVEIDTLTPVPAKATPPAPTQPQQAPLAASTAFPVKRCMNLGNALEAENEGDWGYRIRAKDFGTIATAGFDTVRIPVRWDTHTSNRAPYKIDERFMGRVQIVVSQARSAGLGVILDVHHYEGLMHRPGREEARFLAIWKQISETFEGAPSNLYFEILNEPTRDINMAELNALYKKVIPLIRKTHPTRKLILGGNSWNAVDTMGEVNWPRDNNIVATFHDYGPHEFTHQGAEWSEPMMPMGRHWGGEADIAELRETYDLAHAFQAKTGLPILVGEFGVIDKVPQAERVAWMKARRKAMEASGYAWCAWDYVGAFKTYDITQEQWAPGVLDALFAR
jgi:endoglucanase